MPGAEVWVTKWQWLQSPLCFMFVFKWSFFFLSLISYLSYFTKKLFKQIINSQTCTIKQKIIIKKKCTFFVSKVLTWTKILFIQKENKWRIATLENISVNEHNISHVINCFNLPLIILVVSILFQNQALNVAAAAAVDATRVSSQWFDERVFGSRST